MPLDQTRAQMIGQALGGFGAGLQGQLPQFQAGQRQQQVLEMQQQQQQQQMEQARQKAMFTDAQAGLQLLDEENYDGLVALGMNRLQGLQQLGAQDPSDTQRLTQLALAARNGSEEAQDLLRNELSSTVSLGRATGMLDEPEIPKGASDIGKIMQDFEAGLITEEQRDEAVAREGAKDLGIVQRFKADGSADTLLTDDMGNFFSTTGEPVEVSASDRIIEGSALTGTPEDLGLSDAEFKALRDAEVSTKTFISTVGDALQVLEETPDINTFVAGAAGIVNNLQQEGRAIARALNMDFDESLLDPTSNEDTFDELGIENARMKSLVNALAFQAAAASGQSGRSVSDRDVTRFIREIGADAADPRAFARVLKDVAERSARNFRINYETRLDEDFTGDLGLEALPALGASSLSRDLTELSDEELLDF